MNFERGKDPKRSLNIGLGFNLVIMRMRLPNGRKFKDYLLYDKDLNLVKIGTSNRGKEKAYYNYIYFLRSLNIDPKDVTIHKMEK